MKGNRLTLLGIGPFSMGKGVPRKGRNPFARQALNIHPPVRVSDTPQSHQFFYSDDFALF